MDKKRPRVLPSTTFKINSPQGTIFTTISELNGEPFEVFVNVGKGGSEITAEAEAIGRLTSLFLRSNMDKPQQDRLQLIVGQLKAIGSGDSVGFGPNRVSSIPDGIAQALQSYLDWKSEQQMIEAENSFLMGDLGLSVEDTVLVETSIA